MHRPSFAPLHGRSRACPLSAAPAGGGPVPDRVPTPAPSHPPVKRTMEDRKAPRAALPVRIYRFYRDGFRQMTVGRTLWKIIFIKLFVMFAVLKFFFFPDFLATEFSDDRPRADYVLEQLTPSTQGSRNHAQGE